MYLLFQAFASMFQILTQEGWAEIVDESFQAVGGYKYLVVFMFSLFHMFCAVVRPSTQPPSLFSPLPYRVDEI